MNHSSKSSFGIRIVTDSNGKIVYPNFCSGTSLLECFKDLKQGKDFFEGKLGDNLYCPFRLNNKGSYKPTAIYLGGEIIPGHRFFIIFYGRRDFKQAESFLNMSEFFQGKNIYPALIDFQSDQLRIFKNGKDNVICFHLSKILKENSLSLNSKDYASFCSFLQELKEGERHDKGFIFSTNVLGNHKNSEIKEYLLRTVSESQVSSFGLPCTLFELNDILVQERWHMTYLADFDQLTGIRNRNNITAAIKSALALKEKGALIFFDIDHFKYYNDTYGHSLGDEILKHVAEAAKQVCLRHHGKIGRFGGDEFMGYFPGVKDKKIFRTICSDMKNNIKAIEIAKHSQIHLSITMGGVLTQEDEANFDELFNRMDFSLYRGKAKGGDCYIIYSPEIHDSLFNANIFKVKKPVLTRKNELVKEIMLELNRGEDIHQNVLNALDHLLLYCGFEKAILKIIGRDLDPINLETGLDSSYEIKKSSFTFADLKSVDKEFGAEDHLEFANVFTSTSKLGQLLKEAGFISALTFKIHIEERKLDAYLLAGMTKTQRSFNQNLSEEIPIALLAICCAYSNQKRIDNKDSDVKRLSEIYSEIGFLSKLKTIENINSKDYLAVVIHVNDTSSLVSLSSKAFYENCLTHVASQLKSFFPKNSLIAKQGEHGFVLILPPEVCKDKEEKYLFTKFIRTTSFYSLGQQWIRLSYSIGIYRYQNKETWSEGLKKAQISCRLLSPFALDNISIYDESSLNDEMLSSYIESHFAQAIKNQEIFPNYQPCYDLSTNQVVACEVLSRWKTKKGLIPPDSFIPPLERSGQIIDLDFYILNKALEDFRLWREQGNDSIPVSINFSKVHFYDIDFVNKLNEIVDTYEIPHNLVIVEITETIMFKDVRFKNIIKDITDNGYRLFLDDFGIGYANINMLSLHNFDAVKIDKSFLTKNMNLRDQAVLSTMISLIKKLDLKVLVEGVENAEQEKILQKLRVDYAQGFYYSKPLSIEDFLELLNEVGLGNN